MHVLYGDICGIVFVIIAMVFLFKNLNSQVISYMSARGLMGKHKSIWQFTFDSLDETGFSIVNTLNVTVHAVYLPWFHINSFNIRQVNTFHSNFNVSCNYYDEEYGAKNVRLGGLT